MFKHFIKKIDNGIKINKLINFKLSSVKPNFKNIEKNI